MVPTCRVPVKSYFRRCFRASGACVALLLALVGSASGQVYPIDRGYPAPAAGILLDDATAERAAQALNQAEAITAELELVKAKLAASDARTTALLARIDALTLTVEALTAQNVELSAAQARHAALVERTVTVLEETTATLERARKEIQAFGKRPWWERALDWASRIIPILFVFAI